MKISENVPTNAALRATTRGSSRRAGCADVLLVIVAR